MRSAGEERWLGVFLRFDRLLSDPRTDGNSQQVYFRRDESVEVLVRQGAQSPLGATAKVPLQASELLICDVLRSHGQLAIQAADIDSSRRQAFIFAGGDSVEVEPGLWTILQPALANAQATFDEVDDALTRHFSGESHRHTATVIDFAPHAFVSYSTVQDALTELLDELTSTTSGSGAQNIGAGAKVGTPHGLGPSTVESQLTQLLGWLNGHVGAITRAHNAAAIAAQPHNHINGANVQAQLQEIVDDLESTRQSRGASLVGSARVSGSPHRLATGTVRQQLSSLLAALNGHIWSDDHDDRYYRAGAQVDDADTVDGQHASAFATAGHSHDDRYLRRFYLRSLIFEPNENQLVTTLSARPDLVTASYNYLDDNGVPQATTFVRGDLTNDIRVWVTKQNSDGDKDYQVVVLNRSSARLYISVAAYRSDA